MQRYQALSSGQNRWTCGCVGVGERSACERGCVSASVCKQAPQHTRIAEPHTQTTQSDFRVYQHLFAPQRGPDVLALQQAVDAACLLWLPEALQVPEDCSIRWLCVCVFMHVVCACAVDVCVGERRVCMRVL